MTDMKMLTMLMTALLILALAGPVAAQDEAPPAQPAETEEASETAEDTEAPDPHAEDRAAILDLIERERQAYLDEDVAAIVALYADEVTSVSAGRISEVSREELEASVRGTLENVDYLEVKTLSEPIVRFSPDGRMAWVAVRQRVRRAQKVSEGQQQEGELTFAGAYTLEKGEDGWVKTSSVSTFGR